MEKKVLFEGQKHTIYEYQKALGLSHYALYQYCKNRDMIGQMPISYVKKIAEIEDISITELVVKMLSYGEKEIEM